MKRKAFTLIELLVVIAIIALLLSILMPSLRMAKEHGKRLICGTNLKSIGSGVIMYSNEHGGFIPPTRYEEKEQWFDAPIVTYYFFKIDSATATLSPHGRIEAARERHRFPPLDDARFVNLGYLIKEQTMDTEDGKSFYCASNDDKAFSYQYYGGKANWPMPNLERPSGPEWILNSYSYAPQHRTKKINLSGVDFPAHSIKMANTAPDLSMAVDVMQSTNNGFGHKNASYIGVNMLYGDGSVSFRRHQSLADFYRTGNDLMNRTRVFKYRTILRNLEQGN